LANIESADSNQIEKAVEAAMKSQKKWFSIGGHERAKVLYSIARSLQKHARLAAVLETLDNGKPIRESRDADIPLAIRHFYYHAGWAQLQNSELSDYEPLGVAAQIIPWNFPLLMLAWKIAPAIAMGNSIVIKPAENTPLTAMLFSHICHEAGVPNGVINIVNGGGETGATLAKHPKVNKVAFTGSTAVGREIRKSTAGQGKKLTLELGGKSAFIVFDDADLDSAVEGLVDSIWFNQGEVCCAGSRLLVQSSIETKLHKKIKSRMAKLRYGKSLDKSIDVGSLVSDLQFQRVSSIVEEGLKKGGQLYQANCPMPENNYYPPSIITDIDSSHPLSQEEIFGPVLISMSFRTQSEAVELANNTRYGLTASIWSENINRALDVAPKIKAGVVWINSHNKFDASCGFGGVKESGFGREGGKEGLYEYLKPKKYVANKELIPDQKVPNKIINSQVDRTLKFYIGGKQVRPDGGYSVPVYKSDSTLDAWIGSGNRKDIRDAVSAACRAKGWSSQSAHNRAQILYYFAENLSVRKDEWVKILQINCGLTKSKAIKEFNESVSRLFSYAAWADKYDGLVHNPPYRGITLALPEAVGVIAQIAPDVQPLISCISLIAPAISMGNCVVFIPGSKNANIALELIQVLETSDIPPGVINIVCGEQKLLGQQLAGHAEVDSLWCWAENDTISLIESTSIENIKRLWCNESKDRDWAIQKQGEGLEFLRQATEIKNIWAPYGD
jgi:aldehyde dehydrogenase (NAD+)